MEIPKEHWNQFKYALVMGRYEANYLDEELYAGVCYNKAFNFYVGINPKQVCGFCGKPFETTKLPDYQLRVEDEECTIRVPGQRPTRRTLSGYHHGDD